MFRFAIMNDSFITIYASMSQCSIFLPGVLVIDGIDFFFNLPVTEIILESVLELETQGLFKVVVIHYH